MDYKPGDVLLFAVSGSDDMRIGEYYILKGQARANAFKIGDSDGKDFKTFCIPYRIEHIQVLERLKVKDRESCSNFCDYFKDTYPEYFI